MIVTAKITLFVIIQHKKRKFLRKYVTVMGNEEILGRLMTYLGVKTDTALAKKMGYKNQSTIGNWRSRGTVDIGKIWEAFPEIDLNWLVRGEKSAPIGVPLIPMEAVAGNGAPTYQDLPVEDYYSVAEFRHADFLIRVKGDSMTPKYKAGDIVACQKVEKVNFWQWHTIYVIATRNQGVLIKRVEQGPDGSITCCSENAAYRPFQVPLEEITSVALVMGAIVLE